jgi:hypothetical protein
MARVSGPLHSDTASGTFAKSLTYSTWKGRPYVRECVTPMNPKSAKQTGVRAMMSFLSQIWLGLSALNKATWDDLAAAKAISSFNAFVSECLSRWQLIKGPTEAYPAAEASTPLTVTTQTLTGAAGYATVAITPSGSTNIWALAIFRSTAEITAPSWANCVAVIPANGASLVSYVDSPLDAGTYHYRTAVMNVDGIIGTVKADATCVVTAP